MEDVKWLKLKVGMFDGQSFKRIKKAKIGGVEFRDKLTAVWFELLDLSGKCNHNGAFVDDREIPYASIEDIAIMIDREPEELELCMRFYIREEMVEIVDDVYMLTNWLRYQNEEGLQKIRKKRNEKQAKWRAKRKALAAAESEETGEPEESGGENGENDQNRSTFGLQDGLPTGLPSYTLNSYISNISNNSNNLEIVRDTEEGEPDEEKPKGKKPKEKKPVEQPAFDYSTTNFSAPMISAVESWLQYKTERREAYKPTGLKSLITNIQKNANQYGEQAVIDLITDCMAANYQGIIWDKLKNQKGVNSRGGNQNNTGPKQQYGTCI